MAYTIVADRKDLRNAQRLVLIEISAAYRGRCPSMLITSTLLCQRPAPAFRCGCAPTGPQTIPKQQWDKPMNRSNAYITIRAKKCNPGESFKAPWRDTSHTTCAVSRPSPAPIGAGVTRRKPTTSYAWTEGFPAKCNRRAAGISRQDCPGRRRVLSLRQRAFSSSARCTASSPKERHRHAGFRNSWQS